MSFRGRMQERANVSSFDIHPLLRSRKFNPLRLILVAMCLASGALDALYPHPSIGLRDSRSQLWYVVDRTHKGDQLGVRR